MQIIWSHDDVIKWKHFPRYWPFVKGIHRAPMDSPHKGQWREALMFSLIGTRTNGWANTRDARDLRRHHAHYEVTEMKLSRVVSPITYMWVKHMKTPWHGNPLNITGPFRRESTGDHWILLGKWHLYEVNIDGYTRAYCVGRW